MRKITLVAVFAFALAVVGAGAATASAEPHFLPETGLTLSKTETTTATLRTLAKTKIVCSSVETTINGESDHGMKSNFAINFKGCKEGTVKCGEPASSEEIKTSGTSVLGLAGTTVVSVFKPNTVLFKCSIVLVAVVGSVACPITPLEPTKVKTTEAFTVKCEESALESGDPKITTAKILNAAGTGEEQITVGLTTTIGSSSESSAEIVTAKAAPSVEAEIMA